MYIFRFDIAGINSLSLVDFIIPGNSIFSHANSKKAAPNNNYPESSFEARYERVTSL